MRLFHETLVALQDARDQDLDAFSVLDDEIGWWTLVKARPEVAALAEFAEEDPLITATEKQVTLRRYAPAFEAFTFRLQTQWAHQRTIAAQAMAEAKLRASLS